MKKIYDLNLLKTLDKNDFLDSSCFIKIKNRNIKIERNMVGFNLAVYNGKFYIPLRLTESMVGKMLGSFSFSFNIFLKNKKKKFFKKKKNK